MTAPSRPAVVAHRGNSSVAPQNTLAAFEAAWRAGADSIELDVQVGADGHVVVIHDDTVDATTDGHGAVAELDLATLRGLDAGSWFSPAFAGQRVPTFAEIVDFLIRRPGIDLLLELKGPWTTERARSVTDPLREAGLMGRVIGQSFHPESVAALRHAAPDLRRGLLVPAAGPDLGDLVAQCTELGVMACNPPGPVLLYHPDFVDRMHALGLQVMVWTLDEPEHWAAACAIGVDAIITNRPDRLAGWLAGRVVE